MKRFVCRPNQSGKATTELDAWDRHVGLAFLALVIAITFANPALWNILCTKDPWVLLVLFIQLYQLPFLAYFMLVI